LTQIPTTCAFRAIRGNVTGGIRNQMAIYEDQRQLDKEREQYLEDMERADAQANAAREHELAVLKLTIKEQGRYETIEKVFVKFALIIPFSLCILAVTGLQLFGRPVPKSLEDFLG
jgi:hypothetical protein